MTTVPYMPAAERKENFLNASYLVRSWFTTLDHKRIAILYLIGTSMFFAIGGVAAALVRIHLLQPEGLLFQPETYNRMFTLHGVIMVFFFLVPVVPAVLGNLLVPLMIGARDVAFPRLNLMSWYLYMFGGVFALLAMILGGVDTGWTFYTPYSSSYANTNVILTACGIFIAGFSSILTGLNFIVTIHTMRCPGMTWFRLPLFMWATYATSLIQVLGTPVLAITILMLAIERLFGAGIFNPTTGGDPILFQHMFWFYSHPAVYIMILPGMGVISELVTCFSHKRVFGYEFIAFSSLAIALISFLVWGHHMFVTGQSVYAGMVFSILTFFVAVPSAIKVFNWTATMYRGSVDLKTPMLYAIGFIGLFTVGGLTGLPLAAMGTDIQLTATYFVVAHFHYIMVGGMVMAYMGGLHFWWPKLTGKMYPEWWGRFSALLIFVGFNFTFFPQFVMGMMGMPRRYAAYPPEFQLFHVMSTAGASILGCGYALAAGYFIWSLKWGKAAPSNPWNATGLEWTTTSPPPTENFTKLPIVTSEAYAYDQRPVIFDDTSPVFSSDPAGH